MAHFFNVDKDLATACKALAPNMQDDARLADTQHTQV